MKKDAAGGSTGSVEGVTESRDRDSEQVIIERSDNRTGIWIGCVLNGSPRSKLRLSVVVQERLGSELLLICHQHGAKEARKGAKDDSQHLKVIERRDGLWVKPLIQEDEVEKGY